MLKAGWLLTRSRTGWVGGKTKRTRYRKWGQWMLVDRKGCYCRFAETCREKPTCEILFNLVHKRSCETDESNIQSPIFKYFDLDPKSKCKYKSSKKSIGQGFFRRPFSAPYLPRPFFPMVSIPCGFYRAVALQYDTLCLPSSGLVLVTPFQQDWDCVWSWDLAPGRAKP